MSEQTWKTSENWALVYNWFGHDQKTLWSIRDLSLVPSETEHSTMYNKLKIP